MFVLTNKRSSGVCIWPTLPLSHRYLLLPGYIEIHMNEPCHECVAWHQRKPVRMEYSSDISARVITDRP